MRSTCSLVLIGAALLAGCASTPRRDPTPVVIDPLIEAQHALAGGDLRQAQMHLGTAPAQLEEGDTRKQARVVLLAELAFQNGEIAKAARLAEMVRRADAEEPRAAELLGKVALRQGRFADAAQMFESARIFYTLDDDRQRASDLLRLADGLVWYSEGNVSEARRNWNRIQSPALRAQFERVYASVIGAESD